MDKKSHAAKIKKLADFHFKLLHKILPSGEKLIKKGKFRTPQNVDLDVTQWKHMNTCLSVALNYITHIIK